MGASDPHPTLSVRDLRVSTSSTELLRGISFDIAAGERVGLIGESGSGKSITATAVMGLLPGTLEVSGSILLAGSDDDLLTAPDRRLDSLRGEAIAMVFQEPMTALNPLMRVGAQVAEIMTQHRTRTRRQADARAIELLGMVQLPDPRQTALAYPHQLSGGQRQRVMLAMAMANDPRLLLADEPTTALDVTVQAEVLRLIGALVAERGTSLLFISHDIAVVAEVCTRVLVMHRGEIVEDGDVAQVLHAPRHPYTRSLIAASDLSAVDEHGRLRTAGDGAADGAAGDGAASVPAPSTRASHDSTGATPEPRTPANRGAHLARADDSSTDDSSIDDPATGVTTTGASTFGDNMTDDPAIDDPVFNEVTGSPIIRVRSLTRDYRRRGDRLFGATPVVHGLRPVSFDVAAGQRFGIVGESGSGKSTLLRLLCALDRPTAGSLVVNGQEVARARERDLHDFRRHVQIVFQDPMGSLDPRMTVQRIVAEPLRGVGRDESRRRVTEQLAAVGLESDVLRRRPHEFSGGQRQRISIARALITRPSILVADEAVSALDVSVRAQVLNLLVDLVDQYELTLVFVSHDLGVIRHTCDTVAVLSEGRIVECGPTDEVYDHPRHEYTQKLVGAIPSVERMIGGSS